MKGKKQGLRRWELALLIAVSLAALGASWLGEEQDALADKVVRLHVVANSDSEADQALKLKVRDAVLKESETYLAGLDRDAAVFALEEALPRLGRAAQETVWSENYNYPVKVSIKEEYFPTKTYDNFALPAGNYTALRVELGEGKGHNWWCVVFPPLCLNGVAEVGSTAGQRGVNGGSTAGQRGVNGGLDEGDLGLITGETPGYVVKFKAMELWERFKAGF